MRINKLSKEDYYYFLNKWVARMESHPYYKYATAKLVVELGKEKEILSLLEIMRKEDSTDYYKDTPESLNKALEEFKACFTK